MTTATPSNPQFIAALESMRRALDQLDACTAAAAPREWQSLGDINPLLVEDSVVDTCTLVATYLEALAAAAEGIGSDVPSPHFGDGLAQAIWVAISALRVALAAPRLCLEANAEDEGGTA